jgi:hypothetical protein
MPASSASNNVHFTLSSNPLANEVMVHTVKPARLSTARFTSSRTSGRALPTWEDEVTARYDVQELRREMLVASSAAQVARNAEPAREAQRTKDAPTSAVTAIDVVEVTYEPESDPRAPMYTHKTMPEVVRGQHTAQARVQPSMTAPPAQSAVQLYVLKALLNCYTEYMGIAARTVLKQEMVKLGLTPQTVPVSALPTLVGRLAARLDTRIAADAFLRAVRMVNPALSTF